MNTSCVTRPRISKHAHCCTTEQIRRENATFRTAFRYIHTTYIHTAYSTDNVRSYTRTVVSDEKAMDNVRTNPKKALQNANVTPSAPRYPVRHRIRNTCIECLMLIKACHARGGTYSSRYMPHAGTGSAGNDRICVKRTGIVVGVGG